MTENEYKIQEDRIKRATILLADIERLKKVIVAFKSGRAYIKICSDDIHWSLAKSSGIVSDFLTTALEDELVKLRQQLEKL